MGHRVFSFIHLLTSHGLLHSFSYQITVPGEERKTLHSWKKGPEDIDIHDSDPRYMWPERKDEELAS